MSTPVGDPFYRGVSQIGTDLLQDPLTALTRNRQNNLLLVSGVTILVALAVVTPIGDQSIGRLAVKITNPNIIKQALGFLSLYFLALYLIGLYQDLKVYRYKVLPALNQVLALLEQIDLGQQRKIDEFSTNSVITDELLERRKSYLDATRTVDNEYQPKIDSLLQKAIQPDPDKDVVAILKEVDQLRKERDEAKAPIQNELDNLVRVDKLDESLAKLQQFTLSDEREKGDILYRILRTHKYMSFTRLIIEIVFPTLFSVFAVWQSLLGTR